MKFEKDQCIINFKNGIKLIRHDQKTQEAHLSIAEFLALPFSTYFLNTRSETEIINEEGANVCGFKSANEAHGKTLLDISGEHSASILINNCSNVLLTEKTKIFEEMHLRSDNTRLQFLSVKIPWYDNSGLIIGLMGCSIALGKHSLADALSQLTSFGLLNKEKLLEQKNEQTPQLTVNNLSLSNREEQCLELTIKGMTAKMIAKKLNISHRTVEEYLYNLRAKVGAKSKSELIQLTIDNFRTS